MLSRFSVYVCVGASLCLGAENGWDAKAAAGYLDRRADWWMTWPSAARDQGTFCVSCHTAVPYALGRPQLRAALSEETASNAEQKLIGNIEKRVRLWADVKPFYPDSASAPNRSAESRATEAVLNALILATSARGSGELSAATSNMWAAQISDGPKRGAFPWLDFHNRPWEADDSQYYGSALAAVAAGMLPRFEVTGVKRLTAYLREGYASQSLINRTVVLWASAALPALLPPAAKAALLRDLAAAQSEDGGWSLTALAGPWKRADNTSLETKSDGYATGLAAYALLRSGTPKTAPPVAPALRWLNANQSQSDGRWLAYSLNKKRDLDSDVGRFMSDAATAYAVLALTAANQ